jgi:hypothetical protein
LQYEGNGKWASSPSPLKGLSGQLNKILRQAGFDPSSKTTFGSGPVKVEMYGEVDSSADATPSFLLYVNVGMYSHEVVVKGLPALLDLLGQLAPLMQLAEKPRPRKKRPKS